MNAKERSELIEQLRKEVFMTAQEREEVIEALQEKLYSSECHAESAMYEMRSVIKKFEKLQPALTDKQLVELRESLEKQLNDAEEATASADACCFALHYVLPGKEEDEEASSSSKMKKKTN